MRTEHLKFFVTLAETGSIMQTGKKLYTTHQNVSKVIRQLEDDLDTTLFHRNQKGVTLSATGKLLLPLAQRTMRDFDALRADIQTLKTRDNINGELRLLTSEASNLTLIASIIQIFTELYPDLKIRLNNENPLRIMKDVSLHPNKIGVAAVLSNPEFHDLYHPYLQQIRLTPLIQDSYCCSVGKLSPLAEYKSISLQEFAQHPFAALTSSNEEDDDTLIQLVKKCHGTIAFTSNNAQTYINAIHNGRYVGITSSRSHQKKIESYPLDEQLISIPFHEDMQFNICLILNRRPQLDEASQAFVAFVQNSNVYL